MALKGDLASVGLADVFQMLANNQKVGILAVHGREAWRALYFDRRGVTLYYNEHRFLDRLLEGLVRRHYITADLLDATRREHAGDPIETVETLLANGLIQEGLFLDSFRSQMEEEIYDLFLWEKVHWEFLEGETAVEGYAGVVNENFFFSSDSLIMEAARRLDEWVFIREQVRGPEEIFECAPGISKRDAKGFDEDTQSVVSFVDGKRSVSRITEISGITSFQVHKSLSMLRQRGMVHPLPDNRLIPNANACIADARLDDGIRLLERAVQVGVGLPDAHLLAAKTYEMQSEVARAAWHYKCYAACQLEAGRVDEAVAILEQTVRLLPTDLDAWERFLRGLMAQSDPKLDPHEVGTDLIDLYLKLEEIERARDILEDLLKARPRDIELKKTLISVHTKAGDTRRVMDLYESIANDLVAQKDPIGAVRYLQKILMIDRNQREISDRIKQLYVLDEKHRSRKRNLGLVMAGFLCFGTLGTIYYLYERNVRKAYESIDLEPFLKDGGYEAAISLLKGFLDRYPLSFVESDVQKDLDRIHGMQQLRDAKIAAEQRRLAEEARRQRRSYMKLWREYETMELSMGRALELLEEIRRIAQEAGEPVDKQFLARKNIDEAIATTRRYLAKATRLEQAVETAIRDKNYLQARALALRLHRECPYTPHSTRCLVPFQLTTDPPGAKAHFDARQVHAVTDGQSMTPLWLRLPYDRPVQIKLSRTGFEDLFVKPMGKDHSPLSRVLEVRPVSMFKLEGEPVTGIGVGKGLGVLGLAGGKVVCIDLATGRERFSRELPDLDEVKSTPLVLDRIAVFSTLHGWIRAIRLRDGGDVWQTKVDNDIHSSLVAVREGIVIVDDEGQLQLFGAPNGDIYWTYPTGEPPAADPVWDGVRILYANAGGLLLALDVDHAEQAILRKQTRRETVGPPFRIGDAVAVLGADGELVAYEIKRRARDLWRLRLSTAGEGLHVMSAGGGIFVLSRSGLIQRWDPARSSVTHTRQLPWPPVDAPLQAGDKLFCICRDQKGDTRILSLAPHDLATRWNYPLAGGLKSRPTVRNGRIYLVGADGKIHVLE